MHAPPHIPCRSRADISNRLADGVASCWFFYDICRLKQHYGHRRLACPIFCNKFIEVYCNQFGCANGIREVPRRMSAIGRKQTLANDCFRPNREAREYRGGAATNGTMVFVDRRSRRTWIPRTERRLTIFMMSLSRRSRFRMALPIMSVHQSVCETKEDLVKTLPPISRKTVQLGFAMQHNICHIG